MQNPSNVLADFKDPLVASTAHELTDGLPSIVEKVGKIFYFVRDDVEFGFPLEGDLVKASDTLKTKQGQCNTKGTLFLALCKAVDIPARIHFSLISKEIQKGFFSGLAYWLMPKNISHSWIEVFVEGKWHRIDAYINDDELHKAASQELVRLGWKTGFSISKGESEQEPENNFRLDVEQFEQMAAVVGDHGVWDEPAEYYATEKYQNRPGPLRLFLYRLLVKHANHRVAALRAKHCQDASE